MAGYVLDRSGKRHIVVMLVNHPNAPQADAAQAMKDPDVQAVDLSHDFCKADTCYSVIGGVIAYFNDTHITATFCRTLAPDIERAAQKLLDG